MPTKNEYFKHTKERMYERYNYELTKEVYDLMSSYIKDENRKKAKFLKKSSNRRSVWLVVHDKRHFIAVYGKVQHCIITVLPYRVIKEFKNAAKSARSDTDICTIQTV